MVVLQQRPGPAALELHMAPAIDMSREQFFQFCQLNRNVRILPGFSLDLAAVWKPPF